MAVLTITVDDAQVARVRDAFGVSTNAQLKTAIINSIKQKVIRHEVLAAATTAEESVKTAQEAVVSAEATARASAEAISVT